METDPLGLSPCTDMCAANWDENMDKTLDLQNKIGAACLALGAAGGARVTTVPPPPRITGYSPKDGAIAGAGLGAIGWILTGFLGTIGSVDSYLACMAGCMSVEGPPLLSGGWGGYYFGI